MCIRDSPWALRFLWFICKVKKFWTTLLSTTLFSQLHFDWFFCTAHNFLLRFLFDNLYLDSNFWEFLYFNIKFEQHLFIRFSSGSLSVSWTALSVGDSSEISGVESCSSFRFFGLHLKLACLTLWHKSESTAPGQILKQKLKEVVIFYGNMKCQ